MFRLGKATAAASSLELRAFLEDFNADADVYDQRCQNAKPHRRVVGVDS